MIYTQQQYRTEQVIADWFSTRQYINWLRTGIHPISADLNLNCHRCRHYLYDINEDF